MSHNQKHTNLPMNSFETERKEGWYGYFDCYIDMDGHNPILFPGLHRANSGHLYESGNRLGALYGQASAKLVTGRDARTGQDQETTGLCIEDTFKNTKQFLGGQEPQTWKGEGPRRAAAMGFWAWFNSGWQPQAQRPA